MKYNPEASGCRDILRQVCDANDIRILKGVVSKDHVHMHISYPTKLSVSEIVNPEASGLKCRSSRMLMNEYPALKKRYWGKHFWAIPKHRDGAWSTGNITDEMVQDYLEHHRERPNGDENFILE